MGREDGRKCYAFIKKILRASYFIVRNSFVNSRDGSFTESCSGKFDFP